MPRQPPVAGRPDSGKQSGALTPCDFRANAVEKNRRPRGDHPIDTADVPPNLWRVDTNTAGQLSRAFGRTLGMMVDTHEARTALGAVQLALLSLPQPDYWIYSHDDEAEGPPVALLLAGGRLVEVTAAWEGNGPASVKAVGRELVDGGAVIEMEWRGATFEEEVLRHTTAWSFNFPDGAKTKVPGLVRSMPGEDVNLDEGERFAREVASRLGQRVEPPTPA